MTYNRDLIGYGSSPPHPQWPQEARIAVNFVLNYEEGSEPSVQDGEGYTEAGQTEFGGFSSSQPGRNIAAEEMFAYGSRAGFWRLTEIFRERNFPLTINACALALERNPPAAAAIRESLNDVCCHGFRWIRPSSLSRQEEREHIRKAVSSIEKTIGKRPGGWCSRYGPGENTRELLVEEGGFLYDSDAYNDDLPYWVKVNGKSHLAVPYTHVNNDTKYTNGLFATSQDYFTFHRDAFDVLYREGKKSPKMMSVGLHMRISGHPARSAGVERLLDYIQQFEGVWAARRIDIARHWIKTHPAPD